MANIKQQKKRILQDERNRLRNVAAKSKVKTLVKKVLEAAEAKDADTYNKMLPEALSAIDRAAKGNAIHKNTAGRKKSRLQKLASSL